MSSAWTLADWLQYLLSFGLVISLLLALLWTLRKLQNGAVLRKSFQRMQLVETLSVGPRQKIVLIQVDGREVLIGITAQNMTALPLEPVKGSADESPAKSTTP